MSLKFILICLMLLLISATDEVSAGWPTGERRIVYASSDLRRVDIFMKGGAKLGVPPALSSIAPLSPAKYFQTADLVQCVSVGPPAATIEFAIKRPIRAGDSYRCLRTSFEISRCFEDCRTAIVDVEVPLAGPLSTGTRKAYLLIDSCVGVLAISQSDDFSNGIPLDAAWLRGKVGILGDSKSPGCRQF